MANSEIIGAGQDTARPAPKKILDVCCGPRGMWFDKHNPLCLYLDRRNEVHHLSYPSGNYTETIIPDQIGDFTDIQQPENSFYLVVFDPPHITQEKPTGRICKKYGVLNGEWKEMLRGGFSECFRVLKPNGILIFKWNECRIPISEILALTPEKPLFGHKVGKSMNTHWLCFMKEERTSCAPDSPAQDTVEICHTAPNSAMQQGLKPHAGGTGTSA
jgi:SAM-dependent methyltransferase